MEILDAELEGFLANSSFEDPGGQTVDSRRYGGDFDDFDDFEDDEY